MTDALHEVLRHLSIVCNKTHLHIMDEKRVKEKFLELYKMGIIPSKFYIIRELENLGWSNDAIKRLVFLTKKWTIE